MEPDSDGVYQGNGWRYVPQNSTREDRDTLYLDGDSFDLSDAFIRCHVIISNKTTVKNTNFGCYENPSGDAKITNSGILQNCEFFDSIIINNNRIKTSIFENCDITNSGNFNDCLFALKGTDSLFFSSMSASNSFSSLSLENSISSPSFSGSGKYTDCLFNFDPSVAGLSGVTVHTLQRADQNKLYAFLANYPDNFTAYSASCFYTVGSPKIKTVYIDSDQVYYYNVRFINGIPSASYDSEFYHDNVRWYVFTVQDGDAVLMSDAKELTIDSSTGKPDTTGMTSYNGVYYGDGWEYNTKTETLTILTGHTESFTGPGVNKKLKVNVVVQKGAAVESGRFYKTVENHGTMSQALFCGNVTNTGDGTMKKCTFWDFDFTGNLTITITNEGEMEECIVMNDVTMLTNKGTMIRSSVGAKTVLGNGTYDTCLLAKNYGIAGTHKVTTKNKTDKIDVRLVNDGNQCNAEVEETEVYFTGTPTLKVQIRRYDDGHMARIPLTNVNGDENYGIIPLENNFYIFAVPAEGDVILNDTVKHTLTLQFAEIVNDDGTTPTSGTYVEGEKIRIRPNFGTDSEKVFDGWMSEDINVDTEIVYDDKTDNGTYILTMPGKNATVDAKYKDKAPTTYTLTVVDGKTSTGKTSEELKEGVEVAVDATVPDDKVFTGWTASDGVTLTHNGEKVDLSENHLVFDMPAKTFTLTANFETARTNILFNEDGTLNLDGVKDYEGDGWYYSEGVLYLNPATATEYDFTHVDPQNKDSAKLEAVNVPIHVVKSTVTIKGGTFEAEVESTVADATFKNCVFKGEVDIQAICNVDNCIFTKSCTITNLSGEQNCLFEKEPGGSIVTYELTEASGATVTATLDGCEGEVSGTTLYFSGTPTLKVKVAGGIVEKANNKPVGDADANGWYTVTAAEDDEQIVLTKGEKTTPNPDDQPKTYTVTTDSYGKVNGGASATVKENDWVHMTVAEVPEGMTFDYWGIPDALLKALQKQNSGFRNNVENLNFQMPNMGEEEQTFAIKANFRSSELPGEDDGPSALGTMATVAVGGAAAGILVWQGVSLGVDSYLQLNLPKGVAVPANRRELVVLLWETAGKPETALPSLYSDLPAEEIELQKATRWAIDNGLVKSADDNDASRFDPDRYVTKYDVFGAWLKLKKLMKL